MAAPRFADTVVDLLQALLAPYGEVPPGAREEGRDVLTRRILMYMEQRLTDPHLGPDEIAAAHHISRRYLYKLLAEQGHTVSGWIRERRLTQCRRDLTDPALAHLPVAAIGGRWGYPDPAYFSHAFKSVYGMSPREAPRDATVPVAGRQRPCTGLRRCPGLSGTSPVRAARGGEKKSAGPSCPPQQGFVHRTTSPHPTGGATLTAMGAAHTDYDHIVVGAGSAGCALARRLVDAGRSVLLIETGGRDDNPAIHDPGRLWELWNSPQDHAYTTEPQRHADGTQVFWPRGKVLGGSSALNGMIYVRGHRADYDDWAAGGATGWSYDEVLPYFKRSEDFEDGASAYHGAGGPLPVTRNHAPNPVTSAFMAACQQYGIPIQRRLQRRGDLGVNLCTAPSATADGSAPGPPSCSRSSTTLSSR